MKIAFVILNYNTYQETVDCILSIENKIDTYDYKIIIVDNASRDESANQIAEFIENRTNSVFLRNNENLGFARGNNVGIEYANTTYKPEYVVVLNSDTELIQNDLVSKLDSEYRRSEFALLGPLVLTADGRCDNSPHYPPTIDYVQKELDTFKREERIISLGLYRIYCGIRFFKKLYNTKIRRKPVPSHRNMEYHLYQQQVVLQGCFLVFSSKAFGYVKGFNDKTFLYYEEPILYLDLISKNLTTVYDPEIVIYHKEGRSTDTVSSKSREKLLFINRCFQDSAMILLNKMKNLK